MTNFEELQFKSIEIQLQQQTELISKLLTKDTEENFYSDIPALCNLKKAAEKKGVASEKMLYKRHWLQPCCGKNYSRLNGVRVWPRNKIIEWLYIDDDNLEAYAAKYGVDISKYFKDGKTVAGY